MRSRNFIPGLTVRYLLALLLGIPNLALFYFVFTPLTVYPVFWFLNAVYGAVLLEANTIFFNGFYAQIIPACVAGSAYYLLFALNLMTPMNMKKRFQTLSFLIFTFLALNILRIIFFSSLLTSGFQYFDAAHKVSWYLGSTFLVVALWFANSKLFRINTIPVYSDVKNILTLYKPKRYKHVPMRK